MATNVYARAEHVRKWKPSNVVDLRHLINITILIGISHQD